MAGPAPGGEEIDDDDLAIRRRPGGRLAVRGHDLERRRPIPDAEGRGPASAASSVASPKSAADTQSF